MPITNSVDLRQPSRKATGHHIGEMKDPGRDAGTVHQVADQDE
jgi:hypothetical protein